jgi:hypothetical protein
VAVRASEQSGPLPFGGRNDKVGAELNLGRSVALEPRMPGTGWTPKIVPYADQTSIL